VSLLHRADEMIAGLKDESEALELVSSQYHQRCRETLERLQIGGACYCNSVGNSYIEVG